MSPKTTEDIATRIMNVLMPEPLFLHDIMEVLNISWDALTLETVRLRNRGLISLHCLEGRNSPLVSLTDEGGSREKSR